MSEVRLRGYEVEVYTFIEGKARHAQTLLIPAKGATERVAKIFGNVSRMFGGFVSLHVYPTFATVAEAPQKQVALTAGEADGGERQRQQTTSARGPAANVGQELDEHIS